MAKKSHQNAKASLKQAVKEYWEASPLGSLDLPDVGSREYFEQHDLIYRDEIPYSAPLFEFDQHADELVLDVGCGPGWCVRQYAEGGARVIGIDLTQAAIRLTQRSLDLYGLQARVAQADAENLPFSDGTFDFVVSNGVLHHTPDTEAAFSEIQRILKPGGRALVSLYYRNLLLHPLLFPFTVLLMKLVKIRAPGRSRLTMARTAEEFVRAYDGDANPLGKAYDLRAVNSLCTGFEVLNVEVHFFPKRFLPYPHLIPDWLHRWLDGTLGTMIYVQLRKPAS